MSSIPFKASLLAAAIASGAAVAPAHAAAPTQQNADTTVVLVHGAFADGSSWDKVIPLLQAKGLKEIGRAHV